MLKQIRGTLVMIGECIVMSLDNIRGNKVRSFLTLLGIMIGVTAVIALISTVSGVSGSLTSSFFSMGAGTMSVSVTGSDLKSGLDAADLAEISALDEVDGVTPSVSLNTWVSYGNRGDQHDRRRQERLLLPAQRGADDPGAALNFIDDDNNSYRLRGQPGHGGDLLLRRGPHRRDAVSAACPSPWWACSRRTARAASRPSSSASRRS